MTTATVDIGTLITRTADVRGGRPRIVGTKPHNHRLHRLDRLHSFSP